MLFTLITVFVHSLVMFFVGFIIVGAFSIVFGRSLFGKKHRFFIKILLLNSIIYFLGIFIPEQNKLVVSLFIIIFYFFLFWFLPKIRKKSEIFLSMNRKFIFVIFLVLLTFIGKGEFLEGPGSTYVSDKINVGENGEIFYGSFDITKSNVGFFSEYGGVKYDTIKYDINLDGFVDFKTVDSDEDGEINETIISTYDGEKVRSFLLFILFVLYCLLFSKKYDWLSKIKPNRKFNDTISANKVASELDLGALKTQEQSQPEVADESINIGEEANEDIEENKKNSLNLGALKKKNEVVKGEEEEEKKDDDTDEIENDKDDDQNSGDNNNQDDESGNVEEGNNKQNEGTYMRKEKNLIVVLIALLLTFSLNFHSAFALSYSEVQAEAIKYKNCGLDPFNPAACIGVKSEVRIFLKHMVNPTFIAESQALATEFRNCFEVNKTTCSASEQQRILLKYQSWWEGWLSKKPVDTSEESKTKIILGGNKTKPKIKPQEVISTVTETGKYISDVTGGSLKGINEIVTDSLHNQLKSVGTGNKVNGENIKQLEGMIEKWTGKNGLNVVDKVEELTSHLDSLKGVNLDKYDEALEGFGKIKGGLLGAVKGVGALGSLFESYNDYKDFNTLFDGDQKKTFIATTGTTTGKLFISSNPVDFIMDIGAGVTGLLGYNEYAKKIQEYTLGNRFKQTIEDAYTNDGDSIMSTIEQRASDFLEVYNDPNTGIIEKSSDFLEFSLTAGYGGVIAVTKAGIGMVDKAIDSYTQELFGNFF